MWRFLFNITGKLESCSVWCLYCPLSNSKVLINCFYMAETVRSRSFSTVSVCNIWHDNPLAQWFSHIVIFLNSLNRCVFFTGFHKTVGVQAFQKKQKLYWLVYSLATQPFWNHLRMFVLKLPLKVFCNNFSVFKTSVVWIEWFFIVPASCESHNYMAFWCGNELRSVFPVSTTSSWSA